MESRQSEICRRLGIDNFHFVEIESKKRILPEQARDLRKFLLRQKRTRYEKSSFFIDQFLDTPDMRLFRLGASLRLRYKKNGTKVYLQYKGPGFLEQGLLIRSEFSSRKLSHLLREESHHDIIHFSQTTVRRILKQHGDAEMARAMKSHLGARTLARIDTGHIIGVYQKEKFRVDLGKAFLEPSIDRVFAFHISKRGIHPLSTFCEYENEIKASGMSLNAKLERIPDLLAFDRKVAKKFDLHPEKLDKYHRCTTIFTSRRS